MSSALQIEGSWPGVLTIRRGWGKAIARPWNSLVGDSTLRLVRGNAAFLRDSAAWLIEEADTANVFSPALHRSGQAVWSKAGFARHLELELMEKSLTESEDPPGWIKAASQPDFDALEDLDLASFDRFWHMSRDGLTEALEATSRSVLLVAEDEGKTVGYAIVGAQLGGAFLQRIAVHPEVEGRGIGSDLINAAEAWGRRAGARSMVLNVRPQNDRARRLYGRAGYQPTGASLSVLRYQPRPSGQSD